MKKYRVYVTELRYGMAWIDADTKEEAKYKAQATYIGYHDSEITDIVAEEVNLDSLNRLEATIVKIIGEVSSKLQTYVPGSMNYNILLEELNDCLHVINNNFSESALTDVLIKTSHHQLNEAIKEYQKQRG